MAEGRKTAIIIGAGPAGLTAAYHLLKMGVACPTVLEESPFIGGISRTAVYHGNRIDMGGHRFFTKNKEVMDLWKSLMPVQGAPSKDDRLLGRTLGFEKGGPDPEKTDRVLLLRNRISRICFLRRFYDYPLSLKSQTFLNMGLFRTLKAGIGYLASVCHKRKEWSLEDLFINRFGKTLYQMFFEGYTEKIWGVHPSKISPDWGAQRVKGISLSKAVFSALMRPFRRGAHEGETSLIESYLYPKKGAGQMWEIMAGEISKLGGEIVLNARVCGLTASADGCVSQVAYQKGDRMESLSGNYFFSSMPITDLIAAIGKNVPENVRRVANALPYRDFISVGLLVKRLGLVNGTKIKTLNGLVPDSWIYINERDVQMGRLQIFNNWSPYLMADFENTVLLGGEYFCDEGDRLWNMDDASFIDFAVRELEKIGILNGADVLDAVRFKIKKAYPAYFGSYAEFDVVRSYLDSFSNLYCIGRNGQHRYNNMDHSMLTAIEAVRVLCSGGTKESVWSVNTEAEYHELSKKA